MSMKFMNFTSTHIGFVFFSRFQLHHPHLETMHVPQVFISVICLCLQNITHKNVSVLTKLILAQYSFKKFMSIWDFFPLKFHLVIERVCSSFHHHNKGLKSTVMVWKETLEFKFNPLWNLISAPSEKSKFS